MKKYLSLIATCLLFTLNGYSFTQIVTVQNFSFSPSSFTINLGDTVKWVWANGSHTTTSLTVPSGETGWSHSINSASTSFTYIPSKTGSFTYKCIPHFSMNMTGSFTVVCPNASAQISAATSTVFCRGGSVKLNSNVSSLITSYQWKKNGTDIANATASTYTATSNGAFTLKVINSCGNNATSNAINVTVNPLPKAIITPAGTVTICAGDSVKLKATVHSSQTYMWKRNGNIISGATSSNYFAKTAGNYKVVVTKTTTGCSKTSATTIVVVNNCLNAAAAKLTDNKIQIFPNPSSNDFHVSISSYSVDQYILIIYDVDGKLAGAKKIVSKEFSFGSDLKTGIYFIEVKHAGALIAKEKIIKK